MREGLIIPERIQLEVVFGCNARCSMCPVDLPTNRNKGVMSMDLFTDIVDEMNPYKNSIEKFDLWGLGEPLLDKGLFEKIAYAKSKGWHNLAIATNGDLLDENRQNNLLKSGLDTVIFSIDGCTKKIHEDIRKGVDFDRVVANASNIIVKRNQGDYDTRFVFRFIRQKVNKAEWDGFRDYWSGLISTDKNDIIICYDVHSWGGERTGFGVETKKKLDVPTAMCCHHVFDRLIVLWDGTVALCCSDMHHAKYSLGNVRDASPIEIFNNEKMNRIRELHKTNRKDNIKICKKCSILYSESVQEVIK